MPWNNIVSGEVKNTHIYKYIYIHIYVFYSYSILARKAEWKIRGIFLENPADAAPPELPKQVVWERIRKYNFFFKGTGRSG